ncbi:hypothetical protein [Galbibacter sp. PAP.153]
MEGIIHYAKALLKDKFKAPYLKMHPVLPRFGSWTETGKASVRAAL